MSLSFIYETDRIGVKGLSEFELEGSYPDWFSDAEVCRYNSHFAFPTTKKECESFIKSLEGNRSQMVWAVYLKSNNKHIGNISLQALSWSNRSGEIAFLFGEKDCWGKGFASEAAKLLLKHGFQILNLNRIYCGTASSNLGMRRLALKLGFKEEGCRRDHLFLNGEYEDMVEFGLLGSEFEFET